MMVSASMLYFISEDAQALDETVVEGWVFDQDIMPVANVSISLESGSIIRNAKTDSEGYFRIRYVTAYRNYTITAYSHWTTNTTQDLTLAWGTTNSLDLYVEELDLCGLEGHVRMLSDGRGAYNTAVHFHKDGYPPQVVFADVEGFFRFDSVPSGLCDIIFELGGYETIKMEDEFLERGEWNQVNAQLREIPFDIVSIDPPDGSVDFSVTGSVRIEFTLPLDQDTVDGSNFFIKDALTGRILNTFLYLSRNGTEVDIFHEEYFDHETLYTLYISKEVTNIYNSKLGRTVKVNFTTEVQPLAFQVDSKYPPTDATGISIKTSVRVSFPHGLNESTLDESTVQLFVQGDLSPLEVTMVYYVANRTLLIDPDEDLEPMMRYAVVLSTMIRAAENDKVFTGYSWSFETEDVRTDRGTLIGYVQADDGSLNDIGEIWVTLDNGEISRQTYLDLNGRYMFSDVEQGSWTVTVSGGDYIETSTTVFVRGDETTDADTITLLEKNTEEQEASGMTICVLTVLIIMVVIAVLVVLARKNTKDDEKAKTPPLKVPPARRGTPDIHTVVEGHGKEEEIEPIGVGSRMGPEPVEESLYLLEEEIEDLEISPGPVLDHSEEYVEDEIIDEQLHTLKERIEELEEDIPFVEEPDEDLDIDDEFDVEEFREKEIGGPAPGAVESEPGSPSKPRVLQAPPGFEDE